MEQFDAETLALIDATCEGIEVPKDIPETMAADIMGIHDTMGDSEQWDKVASGQIGTIHRQP